jgi:hypothetical protein
MELIKTERQRQITEEGLVPELTMLMIQENLGVPVTAMKLYIFIRLGTFLIIGRGKTDGGNIKIRYVI